MNPAIGNKVSGAYKLSESQINIAYDWNGQKVALVYTYVSAKNALYFDSEDPLHPAVYGKVK